MMQTKHDIFGSPLFDKCWKNSCRYSKDATKQNGEKERSGAPTRPTYKERKWGGRQIRELKFHPSKARQHAEQKKNTECQCSFQKRDEK